MAKSHYETLGIQLKSSQDEIRSAYRKIAREHHPDVSDNPRSADIFIKATEAYDVLGDTQKRRSYDAELRAQRMKLEQDRLRASERSSRSKPDWRTPEFKKESPRTVNSPVPTKTSTPGGAQFKHTYGAGPMNASLTLEVTRLTMLFNRGKMQDAEQLARKILRQDPRQPIPYAVLGDLSRQHGDMAKAAEHYAFAVQMDPRNDLYRDRYEELLATNSAQRSGSQSNISPKAQTAALMSALFVTVLGSIYLVISKESPLFNHAPVVGTWTLGLFVMLFLSGVAGGAAMSIAGLLDRFSTLATTSLGRTSPSVALAVIAAVNFWAATLLYLAIGAIDKSFNFSTSRVVAAVSASTTLLALACYFNGFVNPVQTFLWGGNICYLGCLCGWMVTDSLRR